MSEQLVRSRVERGVLEISLHRPERKNALTMAMYAEIARLLKESADNSAIRVVILTGSNQYFTSGNDLQDFMSGAQLGFKESPLGQFMWTLATYPKPVIAAVDGPAIGIGTTMLLHFDLVYASPASQFKLPFAKLGLCPEYGSSFLLPRLAGYAKASEWLLLGESFSAEDARQGGLLSQVVEQPLAFAHAQAERMLKISPTALRRSKALMKAPLMPQLQKVMVAEAEAFVDALQSPEFAEAAAAFFEKREPDFSRF